MPEWFHGFLIVLAGFAVIGVGLTLCAVVVSKMTDEKHDLISGGGR